jgi:hypothetical protein
MGSSSAFRTAQIKSAALVVLLLLCGACGRSGPLDDSSGASLEEGADGGDPVREDGGASDPQRAPDPDACPGPAGSSPAPGVGCVASPSSACVTGSGHGFVDGECRALPPCSAGVRPTAATVFASAAECAVTCAAAGACRKEKLGSSQTGCDSVDAKVEGADPCLELAGVFGTWTCGSPWFGYGTCPPGEACCTRGATWQEPAAGTGLCAVSLLPSVRQLTCTIWLP